MKVYCTHCQAVNRLTDKPPRCGHCSEYFPDELYYQQSTISHLNSQHSHHQDKSTSTGIGIATVIAVAVGGGIMGYHIENRLDETRLPLRAEYQIIAQCASQGYSAQYLEQCICALEETQKTVKKSEIEQKFVSTFQANLSTGRCK